MAEERIIRKSRHEISLIRTAAKINGEAHAEVRLCVANLLHHAAGAVLLEARVAYDLRGAGALLDAEGAQARAEAARQE